MISLTSIFPRGEGIISRAKRTSAAIETSGGYRTIRENYKLTAELVNETRELGSLNGNFSTRETFPS